MPLAAPRLGFCCRRLEALMAPPQRAGEYLPPNSFYNIPSMQITLCRNVASSSLTMSWLARAPQKPRAQGQAAD